MGLLVLQYTGFTSCLTRYRWLAASYAKSERYSFLALLLRTEPLVLFAFRLLVSGSVVLSAVSARCPFGARFFVSGFVVCRGLWAMARFWSGFFGGMAGCLDFSLRSRWSLRGCVVTAAGRLSAACRGFGVASYPWEWKGINKKSPFRWVYPRACGGTSAIPVQVGQAVGLSPRVRGNHHHAADVLLSNRSIPARAGEPHIEAEKIPEKPVYPRACGGTNRTNRLRAFQSGLSPRVRGNLFSTDQSQTNQWSIPARAGEPRLPDAVIVAKGVYPRACGGTECLFIRDDIPQGLSPRVRGNPPTNPVQNPSKRSIPARAGEPAGDRRGQRRESVYPRACGGT